MWKSTIKIAFQPQFTASFKKFIKYNVSPEFTSEDEKSHQYFVDGITDAVSDNEDLSFMQGDLNILKELENQEIEYVEF